MNMNKRYIFVKGGINITKGLKRLENNETLYLDLIDQLLKDTNYKDFLLSVNNKDYTKAFEASHALLGILGNLGCDDCYEILEPIVEELKKGNYDYCLNNFDNFKTSYNLVFEAVEKASKLCN